MPISTKIKHCDCKAVYCRCRREIERMMESVSSMIGMPGVPTDDNIVQAYRHLEDASTHFGRAIRALDDEKGIEVKMQTRYGDLHFVEGKCGFWFCWLNEPLVKLGTVIPEVSGAFIFGPNSDTEFSSENLRDVARFMRQLEGVKS